MSKIKKYSLISVISVVLGLLLVFGSTTLNAEPQTGDQGTAEAVGEIYLDGKAGNDDNDGKSTATAVKTFAKAKELASNDLNIKNIYISGTVDLEGDISLKGTNAKVYRASDYNNYLFRVKKESSSTLTNITINGNSENATDSKESLIEVIGTLNIGENTILENNKIATGENVDRSTKGGAVFVNSGTLNMSSGIIKNNNATFGGGVSVQKRGTFNFTGGVIENNEALSGLVTKSSTNYAASGGGICVDNVGVLNISGNAVVQNNYSQETGGGIAIGSQGATTDGNNTLNMDGGTIDSNESGACGGGIFIQAGYSSYRNKAYINSGRITNNTMQGTGKMNHAFGGGGIYVNGFGPGFNFYNGELYLRNAIVTDNYSDFDGAGYASCPVSLTKVYVTNGVALYGNNASELGNEVYIYSNTNPKEYGGHAGNPEYEIADRMLGGNPYRWQNEDNSFLKLEDHKGTLTEHDQKLALHTAEQANDLAKKLGKAIISGNKSATRGGGIGSNGTVIFGVEKDLTEIAVSKVWDDNDNKDKTRPESIEVQLIAKLKGSNEEFVVETRTIDAKAEWKTVFKNLPKENNGVELEYSVKEKDITGYDSKISGNAEDGFTIENKPTPTTTTTTTEATTSTSTTEATTSTTTTEPTTSSTTGTTAPTTSGTEPVTSPTTTPKVPPTTGERVEISMGVSLLLLAVAGAMLAVRRRGED